MPRQARVVIPGVAHHITQRGNNRQDVFFVDSDRAAYLDVLRTQCAKHGVRVLGYCLMTNHVHLIAVAAREDLLQLAVGRAHFVFTQRIIRPRLDPGQEVVPGVVGIGIGRRDRPAS